MFFDTQMRPEKIFRSVPTANIPECEKSFTLELAAPGYEKEDLKLVLEDNGKTLIVKAEIDKKNEEKIEETKADGTIHREHFCSSFERSFTLPENVDIEKISASYKNGVLKIELPKMQENADIISKNIEIQ